MISKQLHSSSFQLILDRLSTEKHHKQDAYMQVPNFKRWRCGLDMPTRNDVRDTVNPQTEASGFYQHHCIRTHLVFEARLLSEAELC